MLEAVIVTCAVVASAGYLARCAYRSIRNNGGCGCSDCDIAAICASKKKAKR